MKRFLQSTRALVMLLMAFNVTIVLALALVGGVALDTMSREEDRESVLSTELLDDVYRLNLAVDQEVLAIRGYLLTGNPRSIVSWDEGLESVNIAQARLEPLLGPDDRKVWAEFRQAQATYEAYGQRVIALKRAGREAEARGVFQSVGRINRAKLTSVIETLLASKKRDIAQIHEDVNTLERNVKQLLALAAGLAIPVTLGLSIWVAWRVVVPLRALEAASNAMAAGQLDTRVVQRFDDEFGRVATAFNGMAEQVESSLRELTRANEELKQVDRAKDEFLSVVSHELRTPLTVILGFSKLLEGGMAGAVNDRQRQYLDKVVAASDRMLALVNDLLDFAKIRSGKLELAPRAAAYGALVEEAAATLKPLADQRGQTLVVEATVPGLLVMDPLRVTQVLVNLMGNAIKFGPQGGAIRVRAEVRDGQVFTSVSDNGPGIASEHHGLLFQRFSQVDMSTTRQTGGAGLGLSICRALVEAHGGAIGVESERGAGATFWFTLPLRVPAATPEAIATAEA